MSTAVQLQRGGQSVVDVWTVLLVTLRRWYVALPIAIAVISAGVILSQRVPAEYAAGSSVVITAPSQALNGLGEPYEVNPYLSFAGSVDLAASATEIVMNSDAHREEVAAAGFTAPYTVTRNGTILQFDVIGTEAEQVLATAEYLPAAVGTVVDDLQTQSGAPEDRRVNVQTIDLPGAVVADESGGTRLLLVLGGLGIGAGVASAVLFDGFLAYRRKRAAASTDSPSSEPSPEQRVRASADGATQARPPLAPEPPAVSMTEQAELTQGSTEGGRRPTPPPHAGPEPAAGSSAGRSQLLKG